MPTDNREYRRRRRAQVDAVISVKSDRMTTLHGKVNELSVTGTNVSTNVMLRRGTRCQVILGLRFGGRHRSLRIKTKVAWCGAGRMGLEFIAPDKHIQEILKKVMAAHPVGMLTNANAPADAGVLTTLP